MNTLPDILRDVPKLVAMLALSALVTGGASAQTPEDALDTFELHPAFQIELVAAEPIVFDPVDLDFDEHGDAYVVEMPGYPFPEEMGRVVKLTDKDKDGVYESRTVFADGFAVATSITPYDGGLLVASPPDLFFIKDTDGDGRADERTRLLTGFSLDNTQHNYNGLTYGLDNWIHGGNGGNSGNVKWATVGGERVSIRGADFRFHIPTKRFEITGRSSGGFEITFDDWGRNFQTHNTQHIYQLVFPGKFIDALPPSRAGTLSLISDHEEGGLARIFSIGVQESRVNHPEQAGYFSGACGITYYGGGAFPDEFNGNVFVCDVVLNLVHRDTLSPNGSALKASRGRERAEFLASTDRSFRPVNMSVGPDGALYLLDMHRDVIEHPEWIPDELEANLDINAGKDKGRIYRITPKTGLPRVEVEFDRRDLESVIAHLGHRNKWWRDTAQRLLVEWTDRKALPILSRVVNEFPSAYGRLHAMWTLEGLGELSDEALATRIDDEAPGVRENALLIAASRIDKSTELREAVAARANDGDPRVRLYAALALQSGAKDDAVLDALASILGSGLDDSWTRMAVAGAVANDAPALLTRVVTSNGIEVQNGAQKFIELMARTVAQHPESGAWVALLQTVDATNQPSLLAAALEGVASGLEAADAKLDSPGQAVSNLVGDCVTGDSPELVRQALRLARATGVDLASSQAELLQNARAVAEDRDAPAAQRVQQLGIYAFAPYEQRADLLYELLDTREPRDVQRAAIAQITDAGDTNDAKRLIEMWPKLGPDARKRAGDFLLYWRPNNALLLDALEDGRLKLGEMNLHLERRRHLLWSDDKAIAKRAEKLFTDAGVVTRAQAIEKMRPALKLEGDVARGHAIYQERCAECHKIGTEGFDVGPNLTDIFRKSPEQLMHDILDPNSAAEPDYLAYTAVPTADNFDADVVSGLLVAETDDAITLRQAGGAETTFARSAIDSFTTTGLSLMPEELEADLTHQQFADLLAFLLNPR